MYPDKIPVGPLDGRMPDYQSRLRSFHAAELLAPNTPSVVTLCLHRSEAVRLAHGHPHREAIEIDHSTLTRWAVVRHH